MRDITHEGAAFALTRLLKIVDAGEDESGDAFRFLKTWHDGKPLEQFEISTVAPAHVSLLLVALFSYINGHAATIRPLAFGKQAEVARLVKGY